MQIQITHFMSVKVPQCCLKKLKGYCDFLRFSLILEDRLKKMWHYSLKITSKANFQIHFFNSLPENLSMILNLK